MKIAALVDGNHLVRRNFYMLSRGKTQLHTKGGVASGALLGSLTTLRRVVVDLSPRRIGMFFDGGHEQATKLYPEYKQNDRDRSEDFYEQCGAFESLVRCLGIPVFNVNGVEADDLIAVS
ncbi:MAG: PIN domain-containing protein, partial [Candidatus Thorarchaeota archaeon]